MTRALSLLARPAPGGGASSSRLAALLGAARPGRRAPLLVCCHGAPEHGAVAAGTRRRLARQLAWVRKHYLVCGLDDLVRSLGSPRPRRPMAAVWFAGGQDEGWSAPAPGRRRPRPARARSRSRRPAALATGYVLLRGHAVAVLHLFARAGAEASRAGTRTAANRPRRLRA